MSDERDELALVIHRKHCLERVPHSANCMFWFDDHESADAVRDAGYRKPREVTTAEELIALPEGAIVVGDWAAFQKVLGTWVMVGGPSLARPELPVLHVWEPQP